MGTASNGIDALEKIQTLSPDLVTLDIEMPKMNGLEVLQELHNIKKHPKILMLSSLTSKDAELTHDAIRLGADDFMLKPKDLPHMREISEELISKVKHLATLTSGVTDPKPPLHPTGPADRVVLIGSSAGGPQQSISCFPCCLPIFLQA